MNSHKQRYGASSVRNRPAARAKPAAQTKASKHTVALRKVGGSLVAAVPAEVVKDLGLRADQTLSVAYDGKRMIIEPAKEPEPRRYTLRQILKSCNFDLPKTEEELEWEASPHMGRETL